MVADFNPLLGAPRKTHWFVDGIKENACYQAHEVHKLNVCVIFFLSQSEPQKKTSSGSGRWRSLFKKEVTRATLIY